MPMLAATILSAFACCPQDTPKVPAHIEWQRTLADALAVQRATGLPILVAVNMNGEVFNDRFRTDTYRDPAFVESTRGYVCVVASPDRHTERDYDALGNRVECPMFPGCTCGEHIAIEPLLYERWFQGRRNAPRHLGITPDGKILFDRFLDGSMQTAIDAIEKHRGRPQPEALPTTAEALLTRRDAAARRAVEGMYRRGDLAARKQLLAAAAAATDEPTDLLRLPLMSEGQAEFDLGVPALAAQATPAMLPLLEDALVRADAGREALLAALGRLAPTDEAAARLHAHLTGERFTLPPAWRPEWTMPAYDVTAEPAISAELDACEAALRKTPADSALRLRYATAQLAFADHLLATGGRNVEFWLDDARQSAQRVTGDRLAGAAQAVIAVASWFRDDAAGARLALAAALAAAAGDAPPNAWLATRLLEVQVRLLAQAAYAKAADPKAVLQPEVARVLALLPTLANSAFAAEEPMLTGIGLCEYAGCRRDARTLLDAAVRRFPGSAAVHERWRNRWLADLQVETMRRAAGELAAAAPDRATGEWFAGYAALVAAEQHVRDGRRDLAVTAYGDAVARFAASTTANPDYADTADHFAVLALAGRAATSAELEALDGAVDDLVRAAGLRQDSVDAQDGLKRTPRGVASRIARTLEQKGEVAAAERLKTAFGWL
ncbi:MAG: hypothetical protein U1E73_04930 [Planctomycetota bacterium]